MTSSYDCRPSDLCDWCIEQLRKDAEKANAALAAALAAAESKGDQ